MSSEMTQPQLAVRRQLARLVATRGADVLDDPRRIRAMLADAVAGAAEETYAIGLALEAGVVRRLRAGDPADAVTADLDASSTLTPDESAWAVTVLAEALGLRPEPVPAATESRLRPAGPELLIAGGGRELRVTPGSVVTIGRDPSCAFVLDTPAVSRTHGQVEFGPDGWLYTDRGSTQGSYVGGAGVTTHRVTHDVEIVLGQGQHAGVLRLVPAGERPTPSPSRAVERTELAGASGMLTVTLHGEARSVAPGRSLTVGREADNDLITTATTSSRHHLRIEHRDGTWWLQDVGSTSGTWHEGARVSELVLHGRQEFVLGDRLAGDHLVTEAPSTAPLPAAPVQVQAPVPQPTPPPMPGQQPWQYQSPVVRPPVRIPPWVIALLAVGFVSTVVLVVLLFKVLG